jgi:hypothetical protein
MASKPWMGALFPLCVMTLIGLVVVRIPFGNAPPKATHLINFGKFFPLLHGLTKLSQSFEERSIDSPFSDDDATVRYHYV